VNKHKTGSSLFNAENVTIKLGINSKSCTTFTKDVQNVRLLQRHKLQERVCREKIRSRTVNWSSDALRMHETAIFPHPLLYLTSPSCSSTPISKNLGDSRTFKADIQCVSKKTSPTFLAVTRESIIGFS